MECGENANFYITVYLLITLQSEFFQDDVFPDTIVSWEPALTGKQWLEGKNGQLRTISLKPEGMTPREVDVGVDLGVWVVGVDLCVWVVGVDLCVWIVGGFGCVLWVDLGVCCGWIWVCVVGGFGCVGCGCGFGCVGYGWIWVCGLWVDLGVAGCVGCVFVSLSGRGCMCGWVGL